MTVHLTIYPLPDKFKNTVTLANTEQSIIGANPANPLESYNNAAQASASAAGFWAGISPNPELAVTSITTSMGALITANNVLVSHYLDDQPLGVLALDAIQIESNVLQIGGGIISLTGIGKPLAMAMELAGSALDASTLALTTQNQIKPAIAAAEDALKKFGNWVTSLVGSNNVSNQPLVSDAATIDSALLSFENSYLSGTGLGSPGSALSDIEASLSKMASDADFPLPVIDETSTNNTLTTSNDQGSGPIEISYFDSVNQLPYALVLRNPDGSASVAASDSDSSVSYAGGDNAQISTDTNGDPIVIVTPGTPGASPDTIAITPDGLEINDDLNFQLPDSQASVDAQGNLTISAATSAANGWQGIYSISNNGQGITYTNNGINLQFDPSDLSSISETPTGLIDFNLNPSVGSGDVLLNSSNGQVTFDSTTSPSGVPFNTLSINDDGSFFISYFDPSTGALQEIKSYDATGIQMGDRLASTPPVDQFVSNFINGTALQTLAIFLKQRNLPLSLLASAAAKANLVQTATNYLAGNTTPSLSSISQQIAANITSLASGMLGTEAGVALFKDLGIDPTIASLLGGSAGKAVISTATQQLTSFIATDVLGFENAGANMIDGSESISDYINALGGAFGDALASAGLGLITSKIVQFIEPNGNLTGEAIGSIVGAAIGSIVPFIGTELGSIIGDLIGGLFGGHSVGPNGSGQAGYNTTAKQFTTANINVDNGGSVAEAQALTSALASVCNQFLPLLNGTVVGTKPLVFSISFIQGQFHILDEVNGPLDYGWYFPTAQAAIDFATIQMVHQLAALQENLDPLVTYALRTSADTTAQQLLTDLTAARLYSLLSTDPASFNAGLVGAMVNDPSNYQSIMDTLARGQQLGFDKLQVTSTGLTYVDTAAHSIADMGDLNNLLTQGLISSIRLSDPGTPVLSISWAQYQAGAAFMNAVSGLFGLAISGVPAAQAAAIAGQPHVVLVSVVDTATSILANKPALQTLLTNNQIGSISVTSDNVANLSTILDLSKLAIFGVPVTQAIQLAEQFNIILVGILDSFTNVFNNLIVLQTIANKTSSISLTDTGTPVFSLTAAEVSANFDALAKLVNSFTINVTDGPQNPITLTMRQLLNNEALFSHFRAYRVAIVDTAANISAEFDELGALARQGTLASIAPTDLAWNLVLSDNQILVAAVIDSAAVL